MVRVIRKQVKRPSSLPRPVIDARGILAWGKDCCCPMGLVPGVECNAPRNSDEFSHLADDEAILAFIEYWERLTIAHRRQMMNFLWP